MAPTNVEVLRRFWELAAGQREFDAAMRLVNDDAEFDWSDSRAPYRGLYRGRSEIRAAWQGWLEAWDVWDPHITESIEVDAETIVIVTQVHARGKGSGVPVEAHGASVWTFREGKIGTAKLFQSKSDALTSVGLPG